MVVLINIARRIATRRRENALLQEPLGIHDMNYGGIDDYTASEQKLGVVNMTESAL